MEMMVDLVCLRQMMLRTEMMKMSEIVILPGVRVEMRLELAC